MDFEYEAKLAIKGNKESFVKLIKSMENRMYRIAKSMLRFDDDCADAIQETILKAYKAINSIKQPQFFKTWLIRILINECKKINMQKSKVIPIDEVVIEKS